MDFYKFDLSSQAVNQPAGNFSTSVSPSVVLDPKKNWKVYLYSAAIWNTSENISAALKNNVINAVVSSGASPPVPLVITFPDGGYGVNDVATFFNNYLTEQGYKSVQTNPDGSVNANYAYFTPFMTTGTTLYLGGNYQVNFTLTPGIANLLGFKAQLYSVPAGSSTAVFISPFQANVQPISSMSITFQNLINPTSSYRAQNGLMAPSNSIFTFGFTVPFGGQESFTPRNLLKIPVQNKTINNLVCQIVDQNGNIVDFGQSGNNSNNPSLLTLVFEADR